MKLMQMKETGKRTREISSMLETEFIWCCLKARRGASCLGLARRRLRESVRSCNESCMVNPDSVLFNITGGSEHGHVNELCVM